MANSARQKNCFGMKEVVMVNRKIYRYGLILVLLVAASLSCKTVLNPDEVVEGLVSTQFEGIVTDIGIEGLVTDMDVESLVTDMGAMITDMDFESLATEVESLATDFDFGDETPMPGTGGQRPQDVPIMPGETSMLSESSNLVMYSLKADFQKVVDFYELEMPNNGWSKVTADSSVEEDFANLVFEKQGRKATIDIVAIPFIGDITVTISITP
jgi:hypothetical protein